MRVWTKKIGPREVSLMTSAIPIISGAVTRIPKAATATLRARRRLSDGGAAVVVRGRAWLILMLVTLCARRWVDGT
jgi:hypothetical protein